MSICEPTIIKRSGKPAIIVVRCDRRIDEPERRMLIEVMEKAISVSPDLKGLPVVCMTKDISLEIVPLPPEPPSKEARTLTPEEFDLLSRLLTKVEYALAGVRDGESELAHSLMESIEARTGHGFERLT